MHYINNFYFRQHPKRGKIAEIRLMMLLATFMWSFTDELLRLTLILRQRTL
jgi:hypothetical protein